MDLPKYYIVGLRPVKAVRTEDGGMGFYALDLDTGEFFLDMWYLAEVDKAGNDDVEEISEEEFNRKVEEFREKLAAKKSG